MSNRIISVAVALVMLAGLFVASPADASVEYTGSVATTDSAMAPRAVFVQGQPVYVVCEVRYLETPSAEAIEVRLETVTGSLVSHFHAVADIPDIGWYNSTEVGGLSLPTSGAPIPGSQDRDVFYVILEEDVSGFEISRTAITILRPGLRLEPDPGIMGTYNPGQQLTAKLNTPYEYDVLYVQTVNSTGNDVPGMNWTAVIAIGGTWERAFVLDLGMPDGQYTMRVRDATTHAIRHSMSFYVQKFIIELYLDRYNYLPGETALVNYYVISLETIALFDDVDVSYQASWVNSSGADCTRSGPLPSPEGNHSVEIPSDIASYSDMWVTYWANETMSIRSASSTVTLYTGMLAGSMSLSESDVSPGDSLEIAVYASVSWEDIPGASLDISVEKDGTPVPEFSVSGLLTDDDGWARHVFTVSQSAVEGTYVVTATISKSGHEAELVDAFTVSYTGWIEMEFDKPYYMSGDSALVRWRAVWNGAEVSGADAMFALIYSSSGLIFGNDDTGTIAFDIPIDYSGDLMVSVIAQLNGHGLSSNLMTSVYPAEVSLVALCDQYRPGDVLRFHYEILTNLPSAVGSWEIMDDSGRMVASGTPAPGPNGIIEYTVPLVFVSTMYTVRFTLTSQSTEVAFSHVLVTQAPDPPLIPSPYLVLDSPAEGLTTAVPSVMVSGTVDPGVWLTVNGQPLAQGSDGSFSVVVGLAEGANEVVVSAMDGMGNSRSITRNVTYVDPIPGLQDELAQALLDLSLVQADLTLALQQLGEVGLTLTDIWDDLNSSDILMAGLQAELDGIRSELTTTHSALNSTQAQLQLIDALEAQIDLARASLNATLEELEAAQSELDTMRNDIDETQQDVEGATSQSTVIMWAALAVVLSVIASIAVVVLMRRGFR